MQRELRVFALYGAIKHSIESLIAARKTHFRLPAGPLLLPLQQRNNAPDQDSRNQASSVQATCNLIYVGDDQFHAHTHTHLQEHSAYCLVGGGDHKTHEQHSLRFAKLAMAENAFRST